MQLNTYSLHAKAKEILKTQASYHCSHYYYDQFVLKNEVISVNVSKKKQLCTCCCCFEVFCLNLFIVVRYLCYVFHS